MVFEGELSVKLHAKDVKVGTNSDTNLRQDNTPVRMCCVQCMLKKCTSEVYIRYIWQTLFAILCLILYDFKVI